ncbi:hypothetical protein ElyMa_005711200 [Elysia marginata]|uniref:Uncharacterized protein n=1 Tax=Elysia marginata TaxID=1093978 RepID=A0AAV4FHA1_9GAST|nr:hypothetical protein ElyMa_005711200 [Elysia marginata]
MQCIQGCQIHLWFKKVDKVGPLKGLLLCQVRSVSREGGWDFSPWVSSISKGKIRQGKAVVENANNEQLKPKLSGIQREEAKYRDTITLESPQGKDLPMKRVKTVASVSPLGMGISLSQPMVELLVQSLKSGSVYSGEKTADRNWHDPLCRGSIGYAWGCKTYRVSKVVDEMGPLKGLWLCRVRSVSRERGWNFSPWASSISRDKIRHGRGVYFY